MSTLRLAARNISIVAGTRFVTWLASFAFTIFLARDLGPEAFGQLSLAFAYVAFFTIFVDFGLSRHLSRIVAQRSGHLREALGAVMLLRAALWLLTMAVAWLAPTVLGYERVLQQTILVLTASVLFGGMASALGAYLQGREEFLPESLGALAQGLTTTGIGVLLVTRGFGILGVAIAVVVASLLGVAVFLVSGRGRGLVRPQIDARVTLLVLQDALPLAFYLVTANFYFNIDMVMLERLAPGESVGWYAAAYRVFSTGYIVPWIVVGVVLYPVLSRLSVGSRAELRTVIEKSLTFLTLAGIAAGLVLFLFAEQVVASLYPIQQYAGAPNALRLLAPGLVLMYLNGVFVAALLGLHQEKRLLAMAFAASVLNPLANLVAMPLFKQDGAALVTSLTELFLLVWLLRIVPRDLLSRESLTVATKAALAAVVAALAIGAAKEQPLPLTVPLALFVYGATLLAMRVVGPDDVSALRALVRFERRPAAAAEKGTNPLNERVA